MSLSADGSDAFDYAVSPETIERLRLYETTLKRWQAAHNLIAPSTVPQIWSRHFADSWQLSALVPLSVRWVDMGSGAGFPGLVIALAMMEAGAAGAVELVEINPRRVAFLREMVRLLRAPARIHAIAIEEAHQLLGLDVGVVTARAFTSLSNLCRLAKPFVDKGAVALLPKGQDVDAELTEATKYWNIQYQSFPSRTADNSAILRVDKLSCKD